MTQWALAIDPVRPPLVHVLLATIMIAPTLVCDPTSKPKRCGTGAEAAAIAQTVAEQGTRTYWPWELVPPAGTAIDPIVIHPGVHPDAQAWPRGMVIKPPETGDRINLAISTPSALDIVLSALGLPFVDPTTSSAASLL